MTDTGTLATFEPPTHHGSSIMLILVTKLSLE